ncbi:HAMP domain-containing sensor histidine kinase [Ferrovibrio sp.]|uniref:sensor histidine kinase n=1 Tax=Ferrovibrio sp. TaxID=1917215 RepID=UPI0025BC6D2A|nr:HAMP domain-containing sensor histidine kinase [Ferrovibrio sp.]MBX3453141.1 HAMP domain-containing histidine kinase [Ferrovibrio sp.]
MKLLRSTSLRVALLFAGLFVVAALALSALLWWNTTGYLDRETDAVIAADTRAVADRLRDFGLPGAIRMLEERIEAGAADRGGADRRAIYLLADPRLRPLAGNVDAWPLKVGARAGWYEIDLVYRDKLHATRLLHVELPGGFQLLVGRDVQDRALIRDLFLRALLWSGLLVLALALGGGWLVRRAVLRRVDGINRTALAIQQGDLTQRLPQHASSDEFDQLAATINRMLDRIQQLVEGVRQVSNTIAHDLRTPLAETRVRLEGLLRHMPEAGQAEIAAAMADIDRLIGVFNALLRLAELDSGLRRAGFAELDLTELVEEAAELYAPSAEAKGLTLSWDAPPGLRLHGDRQLLAQAIGNLIDNAIKYTPAKTLDGAGGRIMLTARADAITVADNGPGMSDEDRTRAAERFYRADSSRSQPGFGLGLSLVQAVARLHGGQLKLSDNAPGLRAEIVFSAA